LLLISLHATHPQVFLKNLSRRGEGSAVGPLLAARELPLR
jgi:hypothetical protein